MKIQYHPWDQGSFISQSKTPPKTEVFTKNTHPGPKTGFEFGLQYEFIESLEH